MKAKDHPAYQYHLTNHWKSVQVAKQLKAFHDEKKGKK
jgi:hypothetical protein